MHQIMNPFPYAEWDCDEVLENLPFKVDAVLLGDYHEHSILKNKTGETWITYPGSTERNSLSEKEARSYNIITLSEKGLEISKRTIPTRRFLSIRVDLKGEDKPYEQIFSKVDEYLEDIPESVTFLEIFGDSGAVLSQSELEEYLLKKGALVSNFIDRRAKESFPEEVLTVTFSDPDHAVASEIRKMNLNDGGLIIDEIVRSTDISKSRVDEETEDRLSKLIEAKATDFKNPDFRIEIPANSSSPDGSADIPSAASSAITPKLLEFEEINPDTVGEAGFVGKNGSEGIVSDRLEITELSGILRTSDRIKNAEKNGTKKSTETSKSIETSKSTETSKGIETSKSTEISAVSPDSSELPASNSQCSSDLELLKPPDSRSTEPDSKPVVPPKSDIPQETSRTSGKTQEAETELRIDKDSEPEIQAESKPEIKPKSRAESKPKVKSESKTETELESESEIKPEIKSEGKSEGKSKRRAESNLENEPQNNPESEFPESKPEKKSRKRSEPGVKGKPVKENTDKAKKLPEEEPARVTELNDKTGTIGPKKGRRKTAVPRQYNLGDYL